MHAIQSFRRANFIGSINYGIVFYFFNKFIIAVINGITVPSLVKYRALVAIKYYAASQALHIIAITASSLPFGSRIVREIIKDVLCIRRLPVILKLEASACRNHLTREVNTQPPPDHIQLVGAVIQRFAGPPIPKPVPVVMD